MGKKNKRSKSDDASRNNKKNKPDQPVSVEENAGNGDGAENVQVLQNGSNVIENKPEQVTENSCKGNETEKSVGNGSNENKNEAEKAVVAASGGKVKKKESLDKKTVFVRGIPYKMKEDDVRELFKDCGVITWVVKDELRGTFFIKFETEDAVKSALAVHGTKITEDRHVKVEMSTCSARTIRRLRKNPRPKLEGPLSVFIGNIPWDVKNHDIREFFKGSKIKSVKLAFHQPTGNCRGFGHVFFVDEESLENALKKDQMELCGRPIKIWYEVPASKR